MIRHSRAAVTGFFILLAIGLAAGQAPAGEWWDEAWSCRREIVFPEGAGAGAYEIVFPAPGLGRPDGGDVRVMDAGKAVPACVTFIDPSGLVHVVFERREGQALDVYWGNAAAVKGDSPPNNAKGTVPIYGLVRAGVLLETRAYDGRAFDTLAEWRKAWDASPVQGRRFVPQVFSGANPNGPSENFLSRHVAYFRAEREGDYLFATDSDDASFLLVDGKPVAEWPGGHGGAANASHSGTVRLKPGVHQLEYCHAQGGGGCLMTAAWRPPGAATVEVMPPEAFVSVTRAAVGALEVGARHAVPGPVADFLPVNAGQAVLNAEATEYVVKMRFENLSLDPRARHAVPLQEYSCRWSFGDGTTSAEVSPEHVYLSEGDFDVTLTLARGYDERKCSMRVRVARDWGRETGAIDLREAYVDIVKSYDVARMEARQAYRAMVYFERVARRDDVLRVGQALLARENGFDEATLFDAVSLVAETMRVQGVDFKGARKLLAAYEPKMKDPGHAAALALAAGDVAMWHLKDLEAAEADYRRVIFTYADKADRMTLRKALVRMGDICRWRHEGDTAREFLSKAQSIPVDDRTPVQRTVRAGFLARSVEEQTAAGEMEFAYETLLTWAWEFPEAQLDGPWTEQRVKWLIKNKEYPGGIAEVESLLKLNPKTPYAPLLLWLAADCAEAAGDKPGAGKLLERVLTDYPEATNKAEVLKRIEALK